MHGALWFESSFEMQASEMVMAGLCSAPWFESEGFERTGIAWIDTAVSIDLERVLFWLLLFILSYSGLPFSVDR